MEILVLGAGCPKCKALHEATLKAASSLELADSVEYITDVTQIMDRGVMQTPCLMIDDKIISAGRVLTPEKIIELIRKEVEA